MAESILRLKVSSEEYDNKLKRATEQLTRYADGCRKVGGTLQYVDDNIVEFTRSLGKMETTATTARGKVSELTKSYTELAVQYKNMTNEEKKGEYGKALAQSLDELKGRIQEGKSQLDDINKSINGGGGLTGALDAVAGKFGLSIDQVTKFGGVVGVATTAVQVAKDAFFQSESGIDEWGRTVEGAKGAYSVFLDTLNNGNWSNFFQNLSAAIQGGRDLYDVFDRLGSIKSNNAAAIAITQKEIAELRLAKQQGENVDAKLKAATERLAALQKQSVSAGMAAGSQSAFQTIRNGVNSIGGAGVNDATIKYVVDKIIKGGQSEFDKYKRNYETLQQRGMVTRTQTINDSQGGTYERQYRVFDINALTKEQQKQYAIAKAITEGETRIQKGIAAYAQAVSEGTSAAREEFKGNRYALQGVSGGRGGRSSGGKITTAPTFAADSIAAQAKLVSDLQKQWNEAGEDMRTGYLYQLIEAENKLKSMKDEQKALRDMTTWGDLKGAPVTGLGESSFSGKSLKDLQGVKLELKLPKEKTEASLTKEIGSMAGGISQMVGSMEALGIELPEGMKDVVSGVTSLISIVSGIATIVTAIEALTAADTIIPFARGGVVHAANGFVQGNNYSGDMIPAALNAGELVLNKAQQGNLASQLQGAGLGGMQMVGEISGEAIKIVLNRHLKRTGQGEIVTW
jgi:hypothetical protein